MNLLRTTWEGLLVVMESQARVSGEGAVGGSIHTSALEAAWELVRIMYPALTLFFLVVMGQREHLRSTLLPGAVWYDMRYTIPERRCWNTRRPACMRNSSARLLDKNGASFRCYGWRRSPVIECGVDGEWVGLAGTSCVHAHALASFPACLKWDEWVCAAGWCAEDSMHGRYPPPSCTRLAGSTTHPRNR